MQVAATANNGIAFWQVPTATDDSGVTPNRDASHNPGQSFPIGTTEVTYTFTDGSGNAAICFFNVVISRTGMICFFIAYV